MTCEDCGNYQKKTPDSGECHGGRDPVFVFATMWCSDHTAVEDEAAINDNRKIRKANC